MNLSLAACKDAINCSKPREQWALADPEQIWAGDAARPA